MKAKIVRNISLLLLCLFVFSGCSLVDFFSAETLLRPPKLTGENAALQAAFEEAVGKDVGLFTPIAGEYRASYIIFDANDDEEEEAIVFYSLNSNKAVVHMHLLTKKADKWYSVSDIIGSGTDVYKVDFFNIDETNELEIAVMWSVDDSKRDKTLSVYRISSLEPGKADAIMSLATILASDYINTDFDNDSVDELLYLYFSVNGDLVYSGVRLMDFEPEQAKFIPMSEIAFDYQVASYSGIINEKNEDGYMIYLDFVLADNSFATELICYDFETATLTVPRFDDKPLSAHTQRSGLRSCEDVNNDGITDIPFSLSSESVYVYGLSAEESVSLSFVRWCYIEDNAFVEIGNYLRNETDGYRLNVDGIFSEYYFSYDYQNRTLQVRADDSYSDSNILFSVSIAKESAENADDSKNEAEKDNSSGRSEAVIVTVTQAGKEKGFEQKDIKNRIEIL